MAIPWVSMIYQNISIRLFQPVVECINKPTPLLSSHQIHPHRPHWMVQVIPRVSISPFNHQCGIQWNNSHPEITPLTLLPCANSIVLARSTTWLYHKCNACCQSSGSHSFLSESVDNCPYHIQYLNDHCFCMELSSFICTALTTTGNKRSFYQKTPSPTQQQVQRITNG